MVMVVVMVMMMGKKEELSVGNQSLKGNKSAQQPKQNETTAQFPAVIACEFITRGTD